MPFDPITYVLARNKSYKYTDEKIAEIAGGIKFMGSVQSVTDLPAPSAEINGHLYLVLDDGHEYLCGKRAGSSAYEWFDITIHADLKQDRLKTTGVTGADGSIVLGAKTSDLYIPIGHNNQVTGGAATKGDSDKIPKITYDAQGHIVSIEEKEVAAYAAKGIEIEEIAGKKTFVHENEVTAATKGDWDKLVKTEYDAYGHIKTTEEFNLPYVGEDGIEIIDDLTDPANKKKKVKHTNAITAGVVGQDKKVPKITYDAQGHITAVEDKELPYKARNGVKLTEEGNDIWIEHTNEITAGTAGDSTKIPKVTYDAQGHITAIEEKELTAERDIRITADGKIGHSNDPITAQTTEKLGAFAFDEFGHVTSFTEKAVVDDLVHTDTDVPLSANMGKHLDEKKTEYKVTGANGTALMFNESDGGGAKFEKNDGTASFVGVNDSTGSGIGAQIYNINTATSKGSKLDVTETGIYYTTGDDSALAPATRDVADNEIVTRKDLIDSAGFLAFWDCSLGKPETFTRKTPYTYKVGDYYRTKNIATAGTNNYKPDGATYTAGAISTVVETGKIYNNAIYCYDGTNWLLINAGESYFAGEAININTDNEINVLYDDVTIGINADNKLIAKNIFTAEYGTTTQADILEAYNRGASIRCKRDVSGVTVYLPLVGYNLTTHALAFSEVLEDKIVVYSCSNTGWTEETSDRILTEDDIRDNLTSDETNKVLSAKQGKVLDEKKVEKLITSAAGNARIFNEADGGGAKFENVDGTASFAGVNSDTNSGIGAQLYDINVAENKGSKLDVTKSGIYYTKGDDSALSPTVRDVEANELVTKKDLIDPAGFLSLWNSQTGSAIDFTRTLPYTYKKGDYFRVKNVAPGYFTHTVNYVGTDLNNNAFTANFAFNTNEDYDVAFADFDTLRMALLSAGYTPENKLEATGTAGTGAEAVAYIAAQDGNILLYNAGEDIISTIGLVSVATINDTVTGGVQNFKPNGSEYTGAVSTTVEFNSVMVGATYYYDGTNWNLINPGAKYIGDDGITVTLDGTDNQLYVISGKELQDRIEALEALGRYLSIWNAKTGLPMTNPPISTMPYQYKTGDYYRIGPVNITRTLHTIDLSGVTEDSQAYSVQFSFRSDDTVAYTTKNQIRAALIAEGYIDGLESLSATGSCGANEVRYIASDSAAATGSIILLSSAELQLGKIDTTTTLTDTITPGEPNYKPEGTQYTGAASTIQEVSTLTTGDLYVFDGTNWSLQAQGQGGGGGTVLDVRVNGTSKVSGGIASIEFVDNLISTATDKALTANQGKVLDEKKVDKPNEPVPGQGVNVPYYFDVTYGTDKATVKDYTVDLLDKEKAPQTFSLDITSATQTQAGLMSKSDKVKLDTLGGFLAFWDCTTGLAVDFPRDIPYTYQKGDYFRISKTSPGYYVHTFTVGAFTGSCVEANKTFECGRFDINSVTINTPATTISELITLMESSDERAWRARGFITDSSTSPATTVQIYTVRFTGVSPSYSIEFLGADGGVIGTVDTTAACTINDTIAGGIYNYGPDSNIYDGTPSTSRTYANIRRNAIYCYTGIGWDLINGSIDFTPGVALEFNMSNDLNVRYDDKTIKVNDNKLQATNIFTATYNDTSYTDIFNAYTNGLMFIKCQRNTGNFYIELPLVAFDAEHLQFIFSKVINEKMTTYICNYYTGWSEEISSDILTEADIRDNLTSIETDAALSAKQGKVLDEKKLNILEGDTHSAGNPYNLPYYFYLVPGTDKVVAHAKTVTLDNNKTQGDYSLDVNSATQTEAGLLSASDKKKLDELVESYILNGTLVTGTTNEFTIDKTVAEVEAALTAGKLLFLKFADSNEVYQIKFNESNELIASTASVDGIRNYRLLPSTTTPTEYAGDIKVSKYTCTPLIITASSAPMAPTFTVDKSVAEVETAYNNGAPIIFKADSIGGIMSLMMQVDTTNHKAGAIIAGQGLMMSFLITEDSTNPGTYKGEFTYFNYVTAGEAISLTNGQLNKVNVLYDNDTIKLNSDNKLYVNNKTDRLTTITDGSSYVTNLAADEGAVMKFEHTDGTWSGVGVNNGGATGIAGQIYAVDGTTKVGTRINVTKDKIYYTSGQSSAVVADDDEIVTKKDLLVAGTGIEINTNNEINVLYDNKSIVLDEDAKLRVKYLSRSEILSILN